MRRCRLRISKFEQNNFLWNAQIVRSSINDFELQKGCNSIFAQNRIASWSGRINSVSKQVTHLEMERKQPPESSNVVASFSIVFPSFVSLYSHNYLFLRSVYSHTLLSQYERSCLLQVRVSWTQTRSANCNSSFVALALKESHLCSCFHSPVTVLLCCDSFCY